MAINIKKLSKEIQEEIIDAYKNNMSMREIERVYGATRKSVSSYLTSLGIKTTTGNHYRKYLHNEDFFENIDTEEKAYWLGFMFADGWIADYSNRLGQDHFGISVSEKDESHLKKFLNSI